MQKIGRYEIERELGRGAMGVVYLAKDTRLGRAVALKTIRLGDFADADKLQRLRERLIREAQSAGSLSHDNIVTIYDVDELDEISYISMEFVEGDSLERMLEKRRELSREALFSTLRQIASGLDFAHSRGIVHRDVKPPNVMVTPLGRVKLTDFGVAKVTYANSMTQGGAMLGTPDYMSPEQIDGRGVDGRADQFSLAVIAFELLTGEKPFIADSLPSLFYRIAHEPAPDAALLNPSLGSEVGTVLATAMAKQPEGRFANCIAFVDALQQACYRSSGWHALPRGMSHTLPTAHEDPGAIANLPTLPGSPAVIASPGGISPVPQVTPRPSAAPEGRSAAVPPAPRELSPLGGVPPRRDAGFITSAATASGEQTGTVGGTDWLAHIEEEERSQRRRRRRGVYLAIAAFLLIGGALAGAYYWLGGQSLAIPGEQIAQQGLSGDELADRVNDAGEGVFAGAATGAESGDGSSVEAESTEMPGDGEDGASGAAADGGEGAGDLDADAAQASTSVAEAEQPAATVPAAKPASVPEVKKPKPAAPSPPRERLATVRFMTEPPGARVTVDAMAELSCETPCSLQVPVGRHTYSARMTGYRNEIRALEVGNYGTTVTLKLNRTVGMVRVSSRPIGASVSVNGEQQSGTTPMTLRLVPGSYQIRVERDGRSVERTVMVREDAVIQLSADLDQ